MPTVKEKDSKKFLKERFLRYGPVVFIRKNIFLFSFLTIFILTLLFGFWNISEYEIYDVKGGDVEEKVSLKIGEYFKNNMYGENYFLFTPSSTAWDMYIDISRLKDVRIEKAVPNRLTFFVEIYEPKYVAYLKDDSCKLLSLEGVVLEKLCEDLEEGSEEGCCRNYSQENSLIFFSSSDVEISIFDNDKDKLLIMNEVKKAVAVVEAFRYQVDEIALQEEVLDFIDDDGRIFRFTIADEIEEQLKRFMVVVARIKSDYMEIGTLDLRFERPVMR